MKVGEACTREVVIVDRNESILEAAKLMRHHHVGDVVVVRDKSTARTPVGILTDRDIVVEVLGREVDPNAVAIGDAMSFDLLTACEDDDVGETLARMRSRGVRRIPVVNRAGGLEGILTLDDYLELVTEELAGMVSLIKTGQQHEYRKRH